MRKTAIKGLVILGIIVLLCVFFSGTLHTITTAKVRIARAKTGRFETEIDMTGSLVWPASVNITVDGMTDEDTLVIRSLPVSAGDFVRAGDVIAECTVSSYRSRLDALQDTYNAREKEYLEQERKNGSMMLTGQHQAWYDTYRRLQEAGNRAQLLRQDLRLEAWKAGAVLGGDDSLPEACDNETLLDLRARLTEAEKEEAAAEEAFEQMKRLNISEDVIAYLEKKDELRDEMEDLTAQMTALRILNEKAASVKAPHDGYITALELKAGDQAGAETPLMTMTAPDRAPVIRLDPGDSKRTVEPGTAVSLTSGDVTVEAVISGRSVRPGGGEYLTVDADPELVEALGGASAAAEESTVSAKVMYRAENPSTLLPVTALRGASGDYYIYTASIAENTLGAERITITRKSVTVLGMNDSVVSIGESLKNESVVYLEDRLLTDGCEVMLY